MGWSGRGKLGVCDKTALPDGCNTARRKLFTHRPICKWSICDEALRTRTSPGRSIPANGIQWIKLLHPFSAESLYLSILPHSSGVNRPRSVPICVSPSSPLPPTPPSSFPSFLPLLLSKIENRTAGNWRSLSLLRPSGFTMLLTAAHLQHTIFRFSFCLLFPLPSSSTSSSPSSTVNSTSPFWNWIFIRDGPGVPVVFMPPSSHQFSFLLSSLHFSPFSPLSPPVNYLLSVRLGQKLHFPPDGYKKKQKKSLQFGVCCCSTGGKRSWEDHDQADNVPLSLPSAVDWRYKMFCTHKDKNFLCYQVTSDNVDMFSLLNYFMHCIKNNLVCFC